MLLESDINLARVAIAVASSHTVLKKDLETVSPQQVHARLTLHAGNMFQHDCCGLQGTACAAVHMTVRQQEQTSNKFRHSMHNSAA